MARAGAQCVEQAARELRRLGVRIGPGDAGRPGTPESKPQGAPEGTLSPRERDIAVLAAAGPTNSQIAGQLFLSTRTVERHLTHVFGKLTVSSRAQLGAVLEPRTDPDGHLAR